MFLAGCGRDGSHGSESWIRRGILIESGGNVKERILLIFKRIGVSDSETWSAISEWSMNTVRFNIKKRGILLFLDPPLLLMTYTFLKAVQYDHYVLRNALTRRGKEFYIWEKNRNFT